MADFAAAHPLDHFFEYDAVDNGSGVSVRIARPDRAIVQVFAARGKTSVVERVLKIKESPGKATLARNFSAIPLAPAQWMLISANPSGAEFCESMGRKLKSAGYVSEQSDSRVIFSLSGPRVVELMQKGCRLDLHPSATGKGWCAQTQIAQCGVIILQTSDDPTYDILVYSGFARSFAEWLLHTGAQLGIHFSR